MHSDEAKHCGNSSLGASIYKLGFGLCIIFLLPPCLLKLSTLNSINGYISGVETATEKGGG